MMIRKITCTEVVVFFFYYLFFNKERIHMVTLQPKELLLDSIKSPVNTSLHCVVFGSDSLHISSSLHWAH